MPATPSSAPASPSSCSTPPWWRASTCAAAGRARARPPCSIRRRRWKASTPSCFPAARPSASMPPPACRPGCASRAAASVRDARGADRAGRDPVRPAQRRRQELGPLPALSRARLRGGESAGADFALGSVGAGLGATTATLKGGVGSASAMTRDGITVGALAVVNAVGSVDGRRRPAFLGGAVRAGQANSAGAAAPASIAAGDLALRAKGGPGENTTHRGHRDRRQADQGAMQAPRRHGAGRARARDLSGAHAARRRRGVRRRDRRQSRSPIRIFGLAELGMVAANVMARAIARGVYEATALPFPGALPSWKDKFGSARETAPPDTAPDRRTASRPPSSPRSAARSRARA